MLLLYTVPYTTHQKSLEPQVPCIIEQCCAARRGHPHHAAVRREGGILGSSPGTSSVKLAMVKWPGWHSHLENCYPFHAENLLNQLSLKSNDSRDPSHSLTDSKTYEHQSMINININRHLCVFPYVCKNTYPAHVLYLQSSIHIHLRHQFCNSDHLAMAYPLPINQFKVNQVDLMASLILDDLRMNKQGFTMSNFPNIPTFQWADLLPSVGVINQNASICGRPQPQASIRRGAHTHQLPHVGGKFHFRISTWHSSIALYQVSKQ